MKKRPCQGCTRVRWTRMDTSNTLETQAVGLCGKCQPPKAKARKPVRPKSYGERVVVLTAAPNKKKKGKAEADRKKGGRHRGEE